MKMHRIERDPLGEHAVPADAVLRHPDSARGREFSHQRPSRTGRSSSPLPSSSRKPRPPPTWRAGHLPPELPRAIVDCRRRNTRRQAARSVRRRRLPGGRRHVAQHERERSAREPRGGNTRRTERRRTEGASERSREHVAVDQRRVPDRPRASRCCSTTRRSSTAPRKLQARSNTKAQEFASVLKVGRTHLQDAVPITLGEVFGGYAACIERAADDLETASETIDRAQSRRDGGRHRLQRERRLRRSGGQLFAVVHATCPCAARRICSASRRAWETSRRIRAPCGACRSSSARSQAILRLLSMGPRAGLSEIALPAVQPGSSIMPGKVNPSMPEMVNQVCYQVMGCDLTVAMAAEAGQLELNVMMPVIAWNALHSSRILREAMTALQNQDRRGNYRRCRARARAARSQHRRRDGAEPAYRLRGDGRDRQGIGAHRQVDSPDRERARRDDRCAARRAARARAHDDAKEMRRAIALLLVAVAAYLSVGTTNAAETGAEAQSADSSPRRISACSSRPIARRGRSPTR